MTVSALEADQSKFEALCIVGSVEEQTLPRARFAWNCV